MTAKQSISEVVKLNEEQVKEGYWVEESGNNVLVWRDRNQIALLYNSSDLGRKVHDVIERRRREFKEVEEKTGWKPDYKKR